MTTRELLDAIVEKLTAWDVATRESYDDALDLWAILTALRGPDSGGDVLKTYTTARIRGVIGLVPERTFGGPVVKAVPLTAEEIVIRDRFLSTELDHFQNHYFSAVRAIKRIYGHDMRTETKC